MRLVFVLIPLIATFVDVVGVEVSDADHVPAGLLTGDQEQEPSGADDSDPGG